MPTSPDVATLLQNPDWLAEFRAAGLDLSAIDKAIRDGYTEGRPPARERKHTGFNVNLRLNSETRRKFFKLPSRSGEYKCRTPKWRTGIDFAGKPYRVPRPCEACDPCKAHAIKGKVRRWDFSRSDLQTTVNVTGAANADEARKLTGALSNTIRGLPDRASLVNESGEILLAFADTIPYELAERIERFFTAPRRNATRAKLPCIIKTEVITGQDLARFAAGERTAQGETRHVSWRLHGDFPKPPAEDDFAFGPGYPLEDDATPPSEPEVSEQVRQSRRWRKEIAPGIRERRRLAARERQARAWCEGQSIVTFMGPHKLLKQYDEFKAGKRPQERAWEHVAVMLGDDIQAMLL